MIFFIIQKGKRQESWKLITELRLDRPEAHADNQIIAWNEVPGLETLEKLRAAVLDIAHQDVQCNAMRAQALARFGIDPLLVQNGGNYLSKETMEKIVNDIFFYWAHPMIGNITNSPGIRPLTLRELYIKDIDWAQCQPMDEETKAAIATLYINLDPLPRSSRDQVRICYNLTELARAIIGEITCKVTRRLEKLLALRLCKSGKLWANQCAMLNDYMKYNGERLKKCLLFEPTLEQKLNKEMSRWGFLEYCAYYLPSGIKTLSGVARWWLINHLLELATTGSSKPHINPVAQPQDFGPDILTKCDTIWKAIPPVIRCAILMNDLRKLDALIFRRGTTSRLLQEFGLTDEKVEEHAKPSLAFVSDNTKIYTVHPAAAPDKPMLISPQEKWKQLFWNWNRDEYHVTTETYRYFLCPLWAGPSGHTGAALQFWQKALTTKRPEWAATVVCGLFSLWRIYFDKRISGSHTMAEAFEATYASTVTKREPSDWNNIDTRSRLNLQELPSTIHKDADAFDLVLACEINPGASVATIDPIGLFQLLERLYYSPSGPDSLQHQQAFDALAIQIDNERSFLVSQKFNVPQWSHELSAKTGIEVQGFAQPLGVQESQTASPLADVQLFEERYDDVYIFMYQHLPLQKPK